MLYDLFDYLDRAFDVPGAGVFRFLTFRAAMAVIVSLIVSVVFGGRVIARLRRLQIGETVRDLGLAGQKQKEGTPTMGGILIILAIVIPAVLFTRLDNVYVQLMLISTVWMGLIGFLDDYIKVFRKNKEGLSARSKIIGQVGLGLLVGVTMLASDEVVVRYELEEAEAAGREIVRTVSVPTRVAGVYDEPQDRESAYEVLKARAEKQAAAEAEEQEREEREKRDAKESRARSGRSGRSRGRQSVAETAMKSAARSVASTIGRALVRGILGGLKRGY